jgi:3-keto-5-aminohexanoate cleavage enzyme
MSDSARLAPCIVCVAPNGARRGRADHPGLPLTADETAREAAAARAQGAEMLHLHVRDRDGAHSLDAELYIQAIAAVRRDAGADLLIQITTESVGRFTPQQQMATVEAVAPEAVSIAVRELFASDADERSAGEFLARQAERGVLVQHILYDVEDIRRFESLVQRGLIPLQGASQILVLGRYAVAQQSDPAELLPLLAARTLPLVWTICAFGRRESAAGLVAAALGGHVRVGFENNMHLPDGRLAPDNSALVANLASALAAAGLRPASAAEARQIFREQ